MATPLSPETIVYGFTSAGDANVSPDGARIVYTLARTDREKKKGGSQLWMCDIDGENTRRLTYNGEANRMARWSPDGTQIAFVSDRKSPNGLFVMPTGGGEAREVVHAATTIVDLTWSADSRRIAFVRPLDPENPSGDKPAEGAAPKVRVTSRIDYKQDNRGYLGDARHQVFVVDVESGDVRQVTSEAFDHTFPRWSPDGKALAAGRTTNNGMRSRLALIPVDGGEATFVGPEKGTVGTWAWSPDGSRIVYTGDPDQSWQADFFVYDVAKRETRRVTTDLQQLPAAGFPTIEPPSMPVWLDEGHVLFHGYQRGASGLFVIDLASGNVEQVDGGQSLRSGLSTDAGARYVVQAFASLDAVGELTVFDRESGESKIITSYNHGGLRRCADSAMGALRHLAQRLRHRSLAAQACRFRPGEALPARRRHSRRTERLLRLRVQRDPAGSRNERLRGGLLQPAWIEFLRPRVHAAGDARLGRRGLPRHHGRRRRGAEAARIATPHGRASGATATAVT